MFAMFLRFGNNFSTYCAPTTIATRKYKEKGSFACGFLSSGGRRILCTTEENVRNYYSKA